MTSYAQKIVQYLDEAHATEQALTRVLQSQIGMTLEGAALQQHLGETRSHAERVPARIDELDSRGRGNPVQAWVGLTETVLGQAVTVPARARARHGRSGEGPHEREGRLRTEALEIATYTAIERLATRAGDFQTARARFSPTSVACSTGSSTRSPT